MPFTAEVEVFIFVATAEKQIAACNSKCKHVFTAIFRMPKFHTSRVITGKGNDDEKWTVGKHTEA